MAVAVEGRNQGDDGKNDDGDVQPLRKRERVGRLLQRNPCSLKWRTTWRKRRGVDRGQDDQLRRKKYVGNKE